MGPTSSLPCPAWVYNEGAAGCPEVPDCGAHPGCDACIVDDNCAWCVAEKACLTVEETFKLDCRGVIFDAIDGVGCPAFMTPGE